MQIIAKRLTLQELKQMAAHRFGDMIKAVVDIENKIVAVDAELHSDLEALLIDNGSKQKNLWGINLYPEIPGDDFIEFDSMINMRPTQGNKSRGIDDAGIREKIIQIISLKVQK